MAWKGQGYLAIEVGTGERVLLVTYAPSGPSVNRLGNHTGDYLRRQLERGVKLFPLYILVGIGGGLSLGLINLAWHGVQWLSPAET